MEVHEFRLPESGERMPWETPKLTVHGSIHEVTNWIGGPWGEFFSGEGSGWNPWRPNPENNTVS